MTSIRRSQDHDSRPLVHVLPARYSRWGAANARRRFLFGSVAFVAAACAKPNPAPQPSPAAQQRQGSIQVEGVQTDCGPRQDDASAFVTEWYGLLTDRKYKQAWDAYSTGFQETQTDFDTWLHGYEGTLYVRTTTAETVWRADEDDVAVVALRLESADLSPDGSVQRKQYRGIWVLGKIGATWQLEYPHIRLAP